MESKYEVEKRAKTLIDSDPSEAVVQYRKIWDDLHDSFNEWDAFYAIKAMRAASGQNLAWARDLVDRFHTEKVCGLYAWLIFDSCVKSHSREDLLAAERQILSLIEISPQKNLQEDSTYPCPTTISIIKLADAYAENLFNARKIDEILGRLNREYLSTKTSTITTEERGDVELASDLEKYYGLKSKALLKLGKFHDCKLLCEEALKTLNKFHYDNDSWFQMRIAICNEKFGNIAESEEQFKSLLCSKAGSSKWFLYRDISELYFEQGDYEKSWKYAVNATCHSNEPQYMIGLYYLQTRILYKLDRAGDGRLLAELLASIIKEQQWRTKDIYAKLISYYEIDVESLRSSGEYLRDAQAFWAAERYRGVARVKGEVVSVHNNGKVGKIRDEQGRNVGFHRNDFVKKQRDLSGLIGAVVEFYVALQQNLWLKSGSGNLPSS